MSSVTFTAEQMALLLSALPALAAASAPTKGKKAKSSAPAKEKEDKEKKPLNPKIAAMNVERMAIFEEMKSAYFSANPSAVGLSKEALKEAVKKGTLPALPTYPQALKEHSRRMKEADPEHAKKADARRVALDAKQAEKKEEKKKAPSKESPPSPKKAPAPAPAPAPAEEEDETLLRPWIFEGKTYFKNGLGYVYEMDSASEPGEYLGQVALKKGKKVIDTSVPEPEGEEDEE